MTDPITADIGYQIHHILPTKVFDFLLESEKKVLPNKKRSVRALRF